MGIPFSHLQRVITDHKISFRPGDILFIRSGFTAAYNALSPAEQLALSKRSRADFPGVEPTEAILEWLWDNQFAAVAGDAPAFERSPVGHGESEKDAPPRVILHQWLLGGWGMPIGEMFDLEELAEHCSQNGRWNFFLSSVPLKVSRFVDFLRIRRYLHVGKVADQCSGTRWCSKPAERHRYLLGDCKELYAGFSTLALGDNRL